MRKKKIKQIKVPISEFKAKLGIAEKKKIEFVFLDLSPERDNDCVTIDIK